MESVVESGSLSSDEDAFPWNSQECIVITETIHDDDEKRALFGLPLDVQRTHIHELCEQRNERMRERQSQENRLFLDPYAFLHPELSSFSEEWLHEDCQTLLSDITSLENENDSDSSCVDIKSRLLEESNQMTSLSPGIYRMRLFSDLFIQYFREELEHFERTDRPRSRPNSMNNYGLVMSEMGLKLFFDDFVHQVASKIGATFFSNLGGRGLDQQHSFTVEYALDGDRNLDFHTDDSEVTFNICLGDSFSGGDLYFRGVRNHPELPENLENISHEPGYAIVHAGLHRHGVYSLDRGHRVNLIIWCRNSSFREEKLVKLWEEMREKRLKNTERKLRLSQLSSVR